MGKYGRESANEGQGAEDVLAGKGRFHEYLSEEGSRSLSCGGVPLRGQNRGKGRHEENGDHPRRRTA